MELYLVYLYNSRRPLFNISWNF